MKIITWNVNGIRATHNKGELASLISTYDPDIIFMQEIKAGHDKIPLELKNPERFTAYYNPAEKPGYAGTGAWVHLRVFENFDVSFVSSFPLDPTANEGRVAHLQIKDKKEKIKDLDIFGIYFPNGGKSEEAWQGKLVFYREFSAYMDSLRTAGHSVLWGGDINCAHHAIDLARPEANDGKIGFHPLERAWMDDCVTGGWHDIWRETNPDTVEIYSWWDPVTRSRDRNVGWRIDAWWGDDSIVAQTRHIEYLPDQMGSDHCPMMIELDI